MDRMNLHRPFLKAYVIYCVLTGVYTIVLLVLLGMACKLFAAVLSIDWRPTPKMIGWIRAAMGALVGYFLFRRVILKEVVPRLPIRDTGGSVDGPDTEQPPPRDRSKTADDVTGNAQE